MEWLAGMWFIVLIGGLPTVLSIVFGLYWLKNERFPWEKAELESNSLLEKENPKNVKPHYERGGEIG